MVLRWMKHEQDVHNDIEWCQQDELVVVVALVMVVVQS